MKQRGKGKDSVTGTEYKLLKFLINFLFMPTMRPERNGERGGVSLVLNKETNKAKQKRTKQQ